MGVGQGSVLSPPLLNIYISICIHILYPIDTIQSDRALHFYVDDGLWMTFSPSIADNN